MMTKMNVKWSLISIPLTWPSLSDHLIPRHPVQYPNTLQSGVRENGRYEKTCDVRK
jgi:hypothetical protein